jgi:putative MATE family efflux protein
MFATIATVIINAILDPLFIYTFGMGISGAAWATIIAQTVALVLVMKILSNKDEVVHFRRGIYHLKQRIVKNIMSIGVSPFCMQLCACFVVILINKGLQKHGGDLAIGAYGIVNGITFMFIMIVMGITQGMQPIAGYNFGAKRYDRMMQAVKYAVVAATVVMTIGWGVCQFMPDLCVSLFTNDKELHDIAVHGLRINAAVLPIIGYQMVITNFFQSIGKAKISIFLSLSRQLLFLIPLLVLLSNIIGVNGVWLALPASDLIAAVVAAWFMIVYMKRFRISKSQQTNVMQVEEIAPDNEEFHRSYSYYTPRSGAAPRGMAPQAGASQMIDEENDAV